MKPTVYVIVLWCTMLLCVISDNSSAQNCPYDEVDCKGECGKFIDENKDSYCDYSLLSKKITGDIISDSNVIITTDPEIKDNGKHHRNNRSEEMRHGNCEKIYSKKYKADTSVIKEENKITSQQINDTTKVSTNTIQDIDKKKKHNSYDLLSVLLVCSLLYAGTYIPAQKSIIKKSTHLKIWNSALLLTFLVSGFFGLLLAAGINYNIFKSYFKTLMFWHVEIGIAMTIISIFHVFWHWKFFVSLVKTRKV